MVAETHIDSELRGLRDKLLAMAAAAETAVNDSMRALTTRDDDLARRVVESDRILDDFEVEIDDLAIQHLTKAPLATDLRLVTRVMKISQNLERIGDEATKVAKRARQLMLEPAVPADIELPRMATLALGMLREALAAFNNRDDASARAVLPQDKEVDLLNKQNQQRLILQMTAHPETVGACLHLLDISKSLERIADHATNVAENVVYLCRAEDIRHTGAKEAPPPAM